jgi:elongation factor Ts
LEKAKIYLRKIGESLLENKKEKETKNGIVEGYIHFNGRVGALVELLSETDFVSQNPEFKKLAHELAMQVAFMNPLYLELEKISQEVIEAKKKEFSEDVMDKPEKVREEIIKGRLKKWSEEVCLLDQPYFKDETMKVRDLINEYAKSLYSPRRSAFSPRESASNKTWKQEIWTMIQKSKDGIKIISAWRYPGKSPKQNPIPNYILEELISEGLI